MGNPFNRLTPAQVERLAILAEECGELQQIIGKILRHGMASCHPVTGKCNRELLENEMGDVLFALRLVMQTDVESVWVNDAAMAKACKIVEYLHHQPESLVAWMRNGMEEGK